MRVLGIDYGAKRVGVALGDTDSCIASPWAVFSDVARLELLRKIRELIENEHVEKIVVGIPHPLGDRKLENEQVKEVRVFVEDLKAQGLDVLEEDETLSSKLAMSQMRDRGEKGKRDDLAAANILQTWLDRNRE